jgi:hypothetical protein
MRIFSTPLVFGWDRSSVEPEPVEVWLRRPRAGQPGISVELKSALAAADGGMRGWLQQQRPTHCRSSMPRAVKPDLSEGFRVHRASVVSLRAVIREHGLRRRPWRWVVTWRSAGERREGRGRVAETHGPNGATPSINPGRPRSRLNAVSGWKPRLLITDFARFINSETALTYGWQGQPRTGISWSGLGHPRGERANTRRRVRWPRAAP